MRLQLGTERSFSIGVAPVGEQDRAQGFTRGQVPIRRFVVVELARAGMKVKVDVLVATFVKGDATICN